jgi:hypothetical protein
MQVCNFFLVKNLVLVYLKSTIMVIALTLPSILWPRMNKLIAVSHKAKANIGF